MTIREVEGDLFDPKWGFPAIAHGVNCKGVMGAGIAKEFRRRYPAMYNEYRKRCLSHVLLPGDVYTHLSVEGPVIFNLATQYETGADAELIHVRRSAQAMVEQAFELGVREVGLPRIGCGIGGLDWFDVKLCLIAASAKRPVVLTVVTLP